MKRLHLLLTVSLLAGLAACGNRAEKERQQLEKRYETFSHAPNSHDKREAKELDTELAAYVREHPNDTAGTPQILWLRAKLNLTMLGDYATAIPLLEEIYNKYPKNVRAPQALQLEAFTYDETLKDKGRARLKYQELIRRYPEHPFAKEAAVLLQLLDQDLNEYTKQFLDTAQKEVKENHLP